MTAKTGSTADMMRVIIRRYSTNQSEAEEKPKPLNPVEIPDFIEQPRDLGATVTASLLDGGLLVILNALFFAGRSLRF